jgi:TctA family transporter
MNQKKPLIFWEIIASFILLNIFLTFLLFKIIKLKVKGYKMFAEITVIPIIAIITSAIVFFLMASLVGLITEPFLGERKSS